MLGFLSLSFVSIAANPAFGQIRQEKFQNLTVDQGLSHFRAYDILQDHLGYIWIGTMDGLNRYDGYSFTVFRNDEGDSTSISDNVITALCEDRHGNLWVGTKDGVLNRLLRSSDTFKRYMHSAGQGDDRSPIRSIYEDSSGTLWVSTLGDGLCRMSEQPSQMTSGLERANCVHYKHDPSVQGSLSSDRVFSMLIDASGVLWVGTDQGLDVLHPEKKEFIHYRHRPEDRHSIGNNLVVAIHEDESGLLWVATGGGGLNVLDRQRERFTRYRFSAVDPNSLSFDFVTSLWEENSGFMWIGTQVGLNRLEKTTGKFQRFRHDPSDPASLIDDYVVRVRGDRSGNVWVVTDRGLSKKIRRTSEFVHYRHESNRFAPQSVTAVLEDSDGSLWIGTESGVKRYGHGNEKMVHYRLSGDYVQTIFEDRKGTIWIGTISGGLDRYDIHADMFEPLAWAPHDQGNNMMSMCEDDHGRLWIGTLGEGLVRFDPEKKKFQHYRHDRDDPRSPSSNTIPIVFCDREGTLWAGTEGAGLNMALPGADDTRPAFVRFTHDPSDTTTISSNRVHGILEDSRDRLWIATGSGLDLLDRKAKRFKRILSNNGPFIGVIMAMVEDDEERLWLSTLQNGLYRFDPITNALDHYDSDDGLQSNRFYFAGCRLRTGEIVFGGEKGFNRFHPDSIRLNENRPHVVLTEFTVFDKPYPFPQTSVSVVHSIELAHDQNYFAFEFAALDQTIPSKNQYMYMLDGLDRGWVRSGKRRLASYTNIDPGKYTFHVKASNNDGVWNDEGLAVAITVRRPYWATWWFRTLVVLAVAGVLAALYRYRVSRLLELERLRLRIAGDLHDGIGSSLGSIALTSDMVALSSGVHEDERKQVAEIGLAARSAAESLRDIVWVMNPAFDRVENLILKLKDEAASMLRYTEYSFDVTGSQEETVLNMESRQNIILMYKEVLHNIVKHSNATFVLIGVEVDADEFRLRIADNGVGFDVSREYDGNGLRNLRRRAEKLGCVEINSKADKGTEIRLVTRIP
ncbi:MAG: hypothetical protein HY708_07745 [Ignavibacteriae bacterium]|nr:hypothetical protein [Ignavibacteriota bacterium]